MFAYAQLTDEEVIKSLEADAIISTNERSIKSIEKNINEVQKTLDAEKNDEKIKEFKDQLTELDGEKEALLKKNSEITNSTDFKLGKIDDDFAKKIKLTTEKGEDEVGTYVNGEGKRVDCTSEEDSLKCRDFVLQKRANDEYIEFLKAQRDNDLCKARLKDPTKISECEEAKKALEAAADTVRSTVASIAASEQERNKNTQFEVTKIFSLDPNDTVGNERRSLIDITSQIADWMILLVSSLAVTALIIGGFMMIISGGDETRLEEGKTIFTYSLIGLTITLLAYGIVSIIQGLFYGYLLQFI
ncbi:MAG: pilin [Candidatus Gracilibacteria bacterium]|nr:pilin [Candidatus Gracilibacteria bacterium]